MVYKVRICQVVPEQTRQNFQQLSTSSSNTPENWSHIGEKKKQKYLHPVSNRKNAKKLFPVPENHMAHKKGQWFS